MPEGHLVPTFKKSKIASGKKVNLKLKIGIMFEYRAKYFSVNRLKYLRYVKGRRKLTENWQISYSSRLTFENC